jgi:hypothetical protein
MPRARKGSSTFGIRVPIQAQVGLRSSASWAKKFFGTESSLEPAWVTKLSAYSRRMPKFLSHAQKTIGIDLSNEKRFELHRITISWWIETSAVSSAAPSARRLTKKKKVRRWNDVSYHLWESSGLAIVYQDSKTQTINNDNCASRFLW